LNGRNGTATVQVRKRGSGRITITTNAGGGPVLLSSQSGVAPNNLTISVRPDSNLGFVRGTQQYIVQIVSPEAVNVEPPILVSFNFRDVADRGTVVPVNGVAVDMQMDTARQRLYL